MPREGYASITVSDKTRAQLEKKAKILQASVPELIDWFLTHCEVKP